MLPPFAFASQARRHRPQSPGRMATLSATLLLLTIMDPLGNVANFMAGLCPVPCRSRRRLSPGRRCSRPCWCWSVRSPTRWANGSPPCSPRGASRQWCYSARPRSRASSAKRGQWPSSVHGHAAGDDRRADVPEWLRTVFPARRPAVNNVQRLRHRRTLWSSSSAV